MALQPYLHRNCPNDIEKGHKGINAFIVEKVGLALISGKKRKWESADRIRIL
jgi:hypothetical protein